VFVVIAGPLTGALALHAPVKWYPHDTNNRWKEIITGARNRPASVFSSVQNNLVALPQIGPAYFPGSSRFADNASSSSVRGAAMVGKPLSNTGEGVRPRCRWREMLVVTSLQRSAVRAHRSNRSESSMHVYASCRAVVSRVLP